MTWHGIWMRKEGPLILFGIVTMQGEPGQGFPLGLEGHFKIWKSDYPGLPGWRAERTNSRNAETLGP